MPQTTSVRDLLRLPAGPVDLSAMDTAATPGVKNRGAAEEETAARSEPLLELQTRLYAEGKGAGDTPPGNRRVLLLLQGTDTCGKDGTVKKVVGMVNPGGTRITSFGKPTKEELSHDFLWRIRNALPTAGQLGVFNRSQYEDVLVVRVHDLVPETEWRQRYDLINAFEAELAADGLTMIKVLLHISYDEQRERLIERLDDPTKHWKFNPGDLAERALWSDYEVAYEEALERCSTDVAPWYVVPADRKWYRDWAVSALLLETLEELDPQYPDGHLDVEPLKAALAPPN